MDKLKAILKIVFFEIVPFALIYLLIFFQIDITNGWGTGIESSVMKRGGTVALMLISTCFGILCCCRYGAVIGLPNFSPEKLGTIGNYDIVKWGPNEYSLEKRGAASAATLGVQVLKALILGPIFSVLSIIKIIVCVFSKNYSAKINGIYRFDIHAVFGDMLMGTIFIVISFCACIYPCNLKNLEKEMYSLDKFQMYVADMDYESRTENTTIYLDVIYPTESVTSFEGYLNIYLNDEYWDTIPVGGNSKQYYGMEMSHEDAPDIKEFSAMGRIRQIRSDSHYKNIYNLFVSQDSSLKIYFDYDKVTFDNGMVAAKRGHIDKHKDKYKNILVYSADSYEIDSKDEAYNIAISLKNAGKYSEAITAFEALHGYKDSVIQIEVCKNAIKDVEYENAISLMGVGKYNEAIAIFEILDGYKDSTSQIDICKTAIKEETYNFAMSLKAVEKYDEAVTAFEKLNGYKDSINCITICKKEILKSAEIGSIVKFGKYEQDNLSENGKEDIEWIILTKEDNKMFVVSKYALSCQKYNQSYSDVTWETCSLRSWLNAEFNDNAFSASEKSLVEETTVSADKNPKYDTNPGNSTIDNVFLLSVSEVNNYFGNSEERECVPSVYAIAQGVETISYYSGYYTCWWWLRTPGDSARYATGVNVYGNIVSTAVNETFAAVRPALWIDLT